MTPEPTAEGEREAEAWLKALFDAEILAEEPPGSGLVFIGPHAQRTLDMLVGMGLAATAEGVAEFPDPLEPLHG